MATDRTTITPARPTGRRVQQFTSLLEEVGFVALVEKAAQLGKGAARHEPGKPRVYASNEAGEAVGSAPAPDEVPDGFAEAVTELMQGAVLAVVRELVIGGRLGELAEAVCELPEGVDGADVDVDVVAEAVGPFVQALVKLTSALLSFAGVSGSARPGVVGAKPAATSKRP